MQDPTATHPVPEFDDFVATIAALRAPDGCPWDKEQTHQSIAKNMIEEAYEAVDAIEADDIPHMREELGDVLLQVVLQSQIASDAGEFDIHDVCREVNEKIIRRHPHVFGDIEVADDANAVLDLWDRVKMAERAQVDPAAVAQGGTPTTTPEAATDASTDASKPVDRLLDGVPKSLPALLQAQKISRKAVAAGFEWETLDDVWGKVEEEIDELKDAYDKAPKSPNGKISEQGGADVKAEAELELGDVLFAIVNVARKMGLDAESALRATNAKFRRRWAYMEDRAWEQGSDVAELPDDEREAFWNEAKAAHL